MDEHDVFSENWPHVSERHRPLRPAAVLSLFGFGLLVGWFLVRLVEFGVEAVLG